MEYQEFICHIKDVMKSTYDDKEINVRKVIKSNDIELDALIIVSKEQPVSPTVYLNDYYKDFKLGRSMEDIVQEICYVYENHYGKLEFDIDKFSNFDLVKDRIVYRLVGRKFNDKFLKDVTYVKYLDFAIIFYYMLDDTNSGNAIAVIHNSHLKMWGITKKELYTVAMANTPVLLPYKLSTMDQVINEMLADSKVSWRPEELCDSDIPYNSKMYVLTNQQKFYGAGCILYENVLSRLAQKLDKDLYILPSSVHEVIIIPVEEEQSSKDELTKLVCEVNKTEVVRGEILSDHAYYYSRKIDLILT
ncbi:MAG: hypothetical protein E7266_09925 [Lachnospiraceae bacterium]|nr:hypothetical protein [Lachnospiraceae bacterium]